MKSGKDTITYGGFAHGIPIACVGEAWLTERDVSPVVFGFWLTFRFCARVAMVGHWYFGSAVEHP